VTFQGVPVEIHTRIMPRFWGLPEAEMLAGARPLPQERFLDALGPEGLLLHAGAHASAHFLSLGLRTAWDLLLILRTAPDLDWGRLAAWVRASRMPRGFWVPVRVLAEELGIPVPAPFLQQAPADARARRLEGIARARLFRATDGLLDLDAISKSALMLLLQDGWAGRARYLAAALAWRAARPGTWRGTVARARHAHVLRQAWANYRRYRRAVAHAAVVARTSVTPLP
jgi:hypothetical protein